MSRLFLWLEACLIVFGLCMLLWLCRTFGLDLGDDF